MKTSQDKGNEGAVDWSRFVFLATTGLAVLLVTFIAGVYSAYSNNAIFQFLKYTKNTIETSLSEVRETSLTRPKHSLQPARQTGAGVTINKVSGDNSLILLAGFFDDNNGVRLIRRDGSIVAHWTAAYGDLFPDARHMNKKPATDWNIDLHGTLVLPDGSVVFNFEYGGLVKLDRCGKKVWALEHSTHHSVEQAEDGSFWVPGRRTVEGGESRFPPFPTPYSEDLILNVSRDGKILREISVPKLFYENGLESLLTSTGEPLRPKDAMVWDEEIVHLNKITELPRGVAGKFPGFEAGDLAISLRNMNLIMVLDPQSRKIKWWQIGPWIRQHDPEFNSDGTLTVFNNNAYRASLIDGQYSDPAAPRVSNIMRVNPDTGVTDVVYGSRPGQELYSVIRGKLQVLADGGFFITEFEGGRAVQVDGEGAIVWEYLNKYDAEHVGEITEARIYSKDYFTVSTWSCPDG